MSTHSIAIVGATGLVGTVLTTLLHEREFPFHSIYFVASQQSAGKEVVFRGDTYKIQDLADFDFSKTKFAFFCVSNDLTAEYAPKAIAAGNIVLDKSSYYRNHPDVPLVIPEVNIGALSTLKKSSTIASPNCNTIPIAVAVKPLYDAVGIERINISTYQSVSGTGKDAITELTAQTKQLLANEPILPQIYPQQIAFNVLPHIDRFEDNGYTREEMKMVWEMQKIFNDPTLAINPTAVRVPVYCGHAASVHIETKEKISAQQALTLLKNTPGIITHAGEFPYPTPARDAAGNDPVYVGRIRDDISHSRGINLWVVADNLRKGAALNSIQIAEYLLKNPHLC